MVILSQTYISKFYSDDLVGEILNNGTDTIKAVETTAIFYNDQDDIIGNATSGTTPYTIKPGDTASFTIKMLDEAIIMNASSYDFTAKWKDEYLANSYFTQVAWGETSDNNGDDDGDDDDDN
ncbi:MAG TPA: FxLYD domain-containing protein [Candidatus Saccharimonadales bacterium]|nr:FxLYD domain-containing protein [Candidatus Saccharimonadales bacterium]